jgi:hypothetical protein
VIEEVVKVEHPAPSMKHVDLYVGGTKSTPPSRAPEIPNPPSEAILDALAGLANRVNEWLAHGPGINLENRLRARINTPGLMEWVRIRLGS